MKVKMPRVSPLLSSSKPTTIIIIFTVLSFNHHFRAYDGQSDMKHNGFSYHGLLRVFALFYMVWKSTKRKLGRNLGFSTSTSFGFKSIWKRGIGRVSLHQMVGAVRRFFARTVPPWMDNTQIWLCKSILQICVDKKRLSQMTIFVKQQLWLALG